MDKSTRWSITVFEPQFPLFPCTDPVIAEYDYQVEVCPTTGKKHYQGWLRTWRQVRFAQLKKVLPGVHLEIAKDWNALKQYCKKSETRDGDQLPVHYVAKQKPMTMADALTAITGYMPLAADLQKFSQENHRMMTPKEEYWFCVRAYLAETQNYESIGLFTNAQIQVGWIHTRNIWIDRQTDSDNQQDALYTVNEIVDSMYNPNA